MSTILAIILVAIVIIAVVIYGYSAKLPEETDSEWLDRQW